MTLPRPPIRRPSLEETIGDSHSRVRGLEAGQTMPYFCCRYRLTWPAGSPPLNTVGGAISPGTTTKFDAPGNEYEQSFNTDPSVFVPGAQAGEVVQCHGGGLYQWGFRFQAKGYSTAPSSVRIPGADEVNLAGGAGSAVCGPLLKTITSPYVAATTGKEKFDTVGISTVIPGVVSVFGITSYLSGSLPEGAPLQLIATNIQKGDVTGAATSSAGDWFDWQIDAYVIRLTPIGAFGLGECSD